MRKEWWIAGVGLVAAAETLLLTRHGPAVAPDTIDYISGAMGILQGRGYTDISSGAPITLWPPLFSMTLAGLSALGLPMLEAARYWNAAAFGALAATAAWLVRRQTQSAGLAAAGCFLVLTSVPLIGGAAAALAEAAFCLLVVLALVALCRSLETGTTRSAAVLGATCGLAAFQRYAGVFLFPGCVALLAVAPDGRSRTARVRQIAVFLAVALLPNAIWWLRNLSLEGALSGARRASARGLSEILTQLVNVFSRWLLPEQTPFGLRAAVLAAVVAAVGIALFRILRERDEETRRRLTVWCALGLTVSYVGCLAAVDARAELPRTGDRYLAPVTVFLLLLVLTAAERWLGRWRWLAPALAAWCLFPAARYARAAHAMWRDAANPVTVNFNTAGWQRSASLDWLRRQPAGAAVYSNAYDAIWFHTGIQAQVLPVAAEPTDACPVDRDCYVVWYHLGGWRSHGEEFPRVAARLEMREIQRFPDATVYSFSARRP